MRDKSAVEEEIKNLSNKILEKYPNVATVECQFCGSGDSFSDFNWITAKDKSDNEMHIESNYGSSVSDLFFAIINYDDRAIFDNDGSEGTIFVDLINNKIKIEVSYFELISQSQGQNEFDNLLSPNKKKPVEFSSFVKTKKTKKGK